jgi:hypothetical protein
MKRLLLLLAFAGLFVTPSISQTEKGWRSVGGTGMIRIGTETPAFNFRLSPELYWFIAEDFALGLDFGGDINTSKPNDTTSYSDVGAYVAPGLRYYFRDVEKKWRPYAFLNAGLETYAISSKTGALKTKTNGTGFLGYAGAGLAWFFNKNAAFDMRLHAIDYTRNDVRFNPAFSIGIQAFFD